MDKQRLKSNRTGWATGAEEEVQKRQRKAQQIPGLEAVHRPRTPISNLAKVPRPWFGWQARPIVAACSGQWLAGRIDFTCSTRCETRRAHSYLSRCSQASSNVAMFFCTSPDAERALPHLTSLAVMSISGPGRELRAVLLRILSRYDDYPHRATNPRYHLRPRLVRLARPRSCEVHRHLPQDLVKNGTQSWMVLQRACTYQQCRTH